MFCLSNHGKTGLYVYMACFIPAIFSEWFGYILLHKSPNMINSLTEILFATEGEKMYQTFCIDKTNDLIYSIYSYSLIE